MRYTVEWFNGEVATVNYEFDNLKDARKCYDDECLALNMSTKNDQKNNEIILGEIDDNEDWWQIESYRVL